MDSDQNPPVFRRLVPSGPSCFGAVSPHMYVPDVWPIGAICESLERLLAGGVVASFDTCLFVRVVAEMKLRCYVLQRGERGYIQRVRTYTMIAGATAHGQFTVVTLIYSIGAQLYPC